ncbi:hypothetical protein F4818DRAFT_409630 [Hypoxylon cercidicola]|nr:hypothetical protein F4818DRAFT_409630 [Hypoxylon cercidicola]
MREFVCRDHFLCWKLRERVEEAAELQRHITQDVDFFNHNNDEVRNRFEETRQWYLKLLDMSIVQLREDMNASDWDVSADAFVVERIMKRVRPVSERYLKRLVKDQFISPEDMDCIIVGGYTEIDDYFADLDANMAAIGSSFTVSVLKDPKTAPNTNQPKDSDEEDFSSQSDEYDETEHMEVDDTLATELALERTSSHSNTPLSTIDLPIREPFNWADDVESELEMQAVEMQAAEASAHQPPTTIPTTLVPHDEVPSDPASSDLSENSTSDPDIEAQESDNSSLEVAPPSPKSDHVEVSESEPQSEETEKTEDSTPDINDVEEPDSPIVEVKMGLEEVLDTDRDSSRDLLMDIWIEECAMPYWQWEMLFILKLAAKRYMEEFKAARQAYKADPFNDIDWT